MIHVIDIGKSEDSEVAARFVSFNLLVHKQKHDQRSKEMQRFNMHWADDEASLA